MKKFFKYSLLAILLLVISNTAIFWYMNRIPPQLKEPNYYKVYKHQDYQIEGQVGIFVSHLIMPEDMEAIEFHTLVMKTMQYIEI